MDKRLILTLNHITGETDWDNPDGLNMFEVMGLLEITKMNITIQEAEERNE